MAKLGSLPADMRRQYEWQCLNSSCRHVFKQQAAGLKCTKCGGTLKKIEQIENVLELTMGD